MAKTDPLLNSFNAGEVSGKLDSRSDLEKYRSACRVMENFIPMVEGGAMSRPGTYFVAEIKDSSKKARLFPFQFSTEQAYVVLAEEGYFRFFKDEGQIVTAPDTPYELANPYSEDEIPDLKITQSADVLYLAHRSHNIKKLSRTGHTAWTLTDFIAAIQQPFVITGASKANPCVVTVTYTSTAWVTATSYTAGDIRVNGVYSYQCLVSHTSETFSTDLSNGLWQQLDFPEDGDIVYISGVVGMTQLNGNFYTVAGANSGAGTFQLSGIDSSAYTVYGSAGTAQKSQFGTTNNCPGAIAFFEQRFMAGGTNTNPLDVCGSVSADFENFTQDAEDDSAAIQYTLYSDKVDSVNWLVGEEYLMIGTASGVWRLGASSASQPLTATNVVAKRQIANGVKDMDAEMVNDAILYVQRGGTTVRKAQWVWEQDKYTALDTTRIAKHITKGASAAETGITDMDYQSEPMSILWSIRADGQLLGMVYEPAENIYPWFRVTTDGEFESVAVITGEDEEDQVWVIVKREIDGDTKRYVEYFKPHELFNVYEDAFFVDSGLTWEGDAAVEVTAISQAAECTITATNSLANGNYVRFRNTGTWLDSHICVVSDRAEGSFKVKTEDGTAYIDSTDFADYPPTEETTTYDGDALSIIAISLENPAKVICPNHGMEATTPVLIAGAEGMTDANGEWEVSNPTSDTFEIDLDATGLDPYTTGGTATPGSTTTAGNGTVEQVAQTVSGFDHLEGESIAVFTDRGKHPACTVESGEITMTYYANKITGGLSYDYNLQPMKFEVGTQEGTSRGKKKRIYSLACAFYQSAGVKWGPDEDNLTDVPFGTGGQPELYTGEKQTDFDADYDTGASIYIQGTSPLPCTVLSVAPRIEVADV